MSMYYTAQKQWAANRLNIARSEIAEIVFVNVEGYSYSEYTEEPGYFCAQVRLVNGDYRVIQNEPRTIIREVCEVMEDLCG